MVVRRRSAALCFALLGVTVLLVAAVTGCAGQPVASSASSTGVGEAVSPAPWDLATPETAVRSYLGWVSFSYRMANSEIATATMTAEESVRVDSYIQLNRQEGKGIEQWLDSLEITSISGEASAAVVTARESWRYRYFSLDTLKYVSEPLSASYDTTYTLVAEPQGWLVDTVEAAASGEVQ